MDSILLAGKQGIKIKEMREFREIVKKLVAKSGIDVEFPKETKRLGTFFDFSNLIHPDGAIHRMVIDCKHHE